MLYNEKSSKNDRFDILLKIIYDKSVKGNKRIKMEVKYEFNN